MSELHHRAPWSHLDHRWIAGRQLGGQNGAGVALLVRPGEGYPVHAHEQAERVIYVLEGAGTHHGTGGSVSLSTDDVLVLPPGSWHGFENTGSSHVRLWLVWAPVAQYPLDDLRLSDQRVDPHGTLNRRMLRRLVPDPATTPLEKGFRNVEIVWDGAAGAESITLGFARFAPGGVHQLHRHPRADEVLYGVDGTALHRTPDRESELTPGTFEFAPAGEWHTALLVGDKAGEGIFIYLGGSTLEQAGYELHG